MFTKSLMHLSLIWLASIVCMTPRFARQDSLLGMSFRPLTSDTLGDSGHYAMSVLYYRGLGPPGESPFSLRPLSPYLASFLPFEPFTALALIGMLGILIGVTAMYFLARRVSGDERAALVVTLLFGFSFPVFYYSSVSIVEGLTFGLVALSVMLLVYERPMLAALAAMVAVGNKEVGIQVVGFSVPFILLNERKGFGRRVVEVVVFAGAALLGWYLSRKLAPASISGYSWPMDFTHAINNLMRVKTTGAILLSLGIQSVVVIFFWVRDFRLDWSYLSDPYKWGFATCVALAVYGYMVGQTDGRFIWYGQIFTTVVLAGLVSRYLKRQPLHGAVSSAA